jgi:hypothetical protein
MGRTAILHQEPENGLRKRRVFPNQSEVLGDSGGLIRAQGWRKGGQGNVNGKWERPADGGDNMEDVSAVDRRTVPGIAGGHHQKL